MNLMVNSLPTRTWNRLGMNETLIQLEGEFKNHTPAAQWDPAEVHWDPNAENLLDGIQGELHELTDRADVGFAATEPDVTMSAPLMLTYDYAAQERGASRLVLHAAERSTLRVVMLLQSPMENGGDISAIQTEIYADKDAKVELYIAQLMGSDSTCLNQITGVCQERASVNLVKLELGAGRVYAGANIDLKGQESTFNTEIGYHGKAGQVLDMNYVALHHGVRTSSLMEVAGTLEDGAKKIFRGTIDFQKGCGGSTGTESENVLLLGDNMVNQTIPLILCKEEDVEGNHGASIGRLDEKVLFYMGSRGISGEMAQQIIAQSRIESICAKIPVESVQEQVREFEHLRGISHDEEEL